MNTQIIAATVQTIIGKTSAMHEEGLMPELKVGDALFQGEIIKTHPGAEVTIHSKGINLNSAIEGTDFAQLTPLWSTPIFQPTSMSVILDDIHIPVI